MSGWKVKNVNRSSAISKDGRIVERSHVLSAGAKFCRQWQCVVDKSSPGGCPSSARSTGALSNGALLRRPYLRTLCPPEPCFFGRSNPSAISTDANVQRRKVLSTGAILIDNNNDLSTGAGLEVLPAVLARREQRNALASKLATFCRQGPHVCRQEQPLKQSQRCLA